MASSLHGCRACQRRLIDAFTSIAGIPSIPRSAISIHRQIKPWPHLKRSAYRSLHSSTIRWQTREPEVQANQLEQLVSDDGSTTQSQAESTEASSQTESDSSASPSEQSPQPKSTDHVPWYLQVSTPDPIHPVAQTFESELPPLPENSPTILPSLLQHLSISIGLDNLSIVDLRNLSPPSPLGANLLMIIGTARSEKHLNTSADRFCRWLRTPYHLRPYADGLLGRNEIKLKLRRRNKKLKLAQSVGNTSFDKSYDDGITTGWICCNLGAVDDIGTEQASEDHPEYSKKDQERIREDEDEYVNPSENSVVESDFKYRGFGSVSNSPRVVVQMFTEEKRLEMDLEGLWESRIEKRHRKEEKAAQEVFETSSIEAEIERPSVREGSR